MGDLAIVPLRWTINVRDATADLANGILIVRLPKAQDRRGKEFKIGVKDINLLEGEYKVWPASHRFEKGTFKQELR